MSNLDQLCVNTIRTLAMDAVQRANSGHPGMPMGMAPAAYALWTRFLRHNPKNPDWPDRDRFVLSAGHGSMLLYSLLHLTGYDLPLEELKNFRQWGSKTPGHPEYGHAPGVETTTGPLGQGFTNGVGMALAEKFLAATFNREGHPIVDHTIYAIVSDGDLMEGISHEAASLAGHLKLDNLVYLYDDNSISIDGPTELSFSEDVLERFAAYGWHTQRVEDGNDLEKIERAIRAAQQQGQRPALIAVKSHIGYGSPNKQDTAEAHGSPLGEDEIKLTKEKLGWPHEEPFHIPEEALEKFREAVARGEEVEAEWNERFVRYREAHPELAQRCEDALAGKLPEGWERALPGFNPGDKPLATRKASGAVLDAIAAKIPTLVGGSADLTPSNNTQAKGMTPFGPEDYAGRYVHFGVREHAMGGVLNGMSLHGGLLPYGGTFLIFSDYMRPSVRLAALMGRPVTYVYTHDSVGLGEDGPTHQPVEQLMGLRAIPNLVVLRPADGAETAAAWKVALERRDGPTALALTRQGLPHLPHDEDVYASVARGGYVLADAPGGEPEIVLIGTGSEAQLALEAQKKLVSDGVAARAVSLPSWELFEAQPASYRDAVLPPAAKRVAVEAGVSLGWARYVGLNGAVIGLDRFGASAPGDVAMAELGFTVENVLAAAKQLLANS